MDDGELQKAIEQRVRKQFKDCVIEDVIVKRAFDADGDDIVDVVVVLSEREHVTGVSSFASKLWADLCRKNLGFPILSFRTVAENARLSAAA
jgi:hypothetical protein